MISRIPLDELIHVGPKMTKQEKNSKWAEHFFSKNEEKVKDDLDDFNQRWIKKFGKPMGE